ncbi:hypothetical protein [Undibacterium sp. RuRC25W]|uniref:hypothetical protein n=1 Tax=Undibacterium sp. RuRC25W TaxID=3413047 RepID=UPI003BF13342
MKFKLALILALQVFTTTAFAEDKPATPAPTTMQSVILVAPSETDNAASGVQIDLPKMPPEKRNPHANDPIQTWSGDVPVTGIVFLLIASMPVLASLYFAYQLFLFIQARRRKLTIRHQRD